MGHPIEGLVKNGEVPHQGMIAVKVKRGPYVSGDLRNRNLFTVKLTILILEEMHPHAPSVRSNEFGVRGDFQKNMSVQLWTPQSFILRMKTPNSTLRTPNFSIGT
jgi:hypothetical protein